ncbi:four helix bundle protein [Flavobacterium enshiense]|uniref:four helix bundle protein n=1 Tax=Flavobacterium enshiense TaxID=1341165 RepID=UPI00345CEFF1
MVLEIYKVTGNFPKEELYGLTSQMRRSAASIPTNVVEGCGRNTDKDFCRFLYIAFGSANELEYQLILSKDLIFLESEKATALISKIEEIKKMLNTLISILEAEKLIAKS